MRKLVIFLSSFATLTMLVELVSMDKVEESSGQSSGESAIIHSYIGIQPHAPYLLIIHVYGYPK